MTSCRRMVTGRTIGRLGVAQMSIHHDTQHDTQRNIQSVTA